MKQLLGGITAVLLLAMTTLAAPSVPRDTPVFPKTLTNARYIYVTSYDGDQLSLNIRTEDRQAIGAVQDALRKSGKFVVVYHPREADIVLMVESHPSEDVLAVYDASEWPRSGTYLWRVMGRDGLQQSETPLVKQFLQAFDKAAK